MAKRKPSRKKQPVSAAQRAEAKVLKKLEALILGVLNDPRFNADGVPNNYTLDHLRLVNHYAFDPAQPGFVAMHVHESSEYTYVDSRAISTLSELLGANYVTVGVNQDTGRGQTLTFCELNADAVRQMLKDLK